MMGSVLMARMKEEGDFVGFKPFFFSLTQAGHKALEVGLDAPPVRDAFDTDLLFSLNHSRVNSHFGTYRYRKSSRPFRTVISSLAYSKSSADISSTTEAFSLI